jgi:PD-(D/E)XK endonuclease
MDHPKDIGDRSTIAIMAVLREVGYAIYAPFGENTRTDLVVDDGSRLVRVQCKTGRLRKGAVRFSVCSCYGHHRNPAQARRDYHGQVEAFAVYCPETTAVYVIPIDAIAARAEGALRVDPPRNNQVRGIRFADDYEIGRASITRTGP